MRRLCILLAGTALSVTAAASAIETGLMTLSRAETLALQNDENLKLETANIDARRELIDSADQLPDPRLRLAALNYPKDTFDADQEPMTQNLVGIKQEFPAGKSRHIRKLKAEASLREASARHRQVKAELLREVRRLWISVYELEQQLALVDERRKIYQDFLATAVGAYRVGRTSQQQVVGVRIQLATLDDKQFELQGRSNATRAELALWLGEQAHSPWPNALPDGLKMLPASLDEAHPELAVLEAKTEQMRHEVKLARQAYKPEWSLDMNYGRRADRTDLVSVGVQVSLPLFRGSRQDRKLAAKQAELSASIHARNDRLFALQSREQALRSQADSRLLRIEGYETSILPQLGDVTRLTTSDYQQGRADYSALLEALEAEIDARDTLVTLRTGLARDVTELRYLNEEVGS